MNAFVNILTSEQDTFNLNSRKHHILAMIMFHAFRAP